jgi:hypothetical protein
MARHTDVIIGRAETTHDEQVSGSLAKAINDVLGSAAAIQGITAVKIGVFTAVIVVWDDS